MNTARRKRLKPFALIVCFAFITGSLFNNCSNGFSTMEPISSELSSTIGDGTIPTPPVTTPTIPPTPTPTNPVQPPAAPIEPIVSNTNPSWMAGKNLNEWMEIPNTMGAGGAALFAFSGFALREANSELIIGAAGGHLDSSDNRVVSLVLETDQPKWQLRIAPSPYPQMDVSHYKDGTPSSRHTYHSTFYIESLHRLFLFGNRGAYGTPVSFATIDAFDFKTNQWDPPNTWANLPNPASYGTAQISPSGDVFTMNTLHRFSASKALAALNAGNSSTTDMWSSPISVRTKAHIRFPVAYDKKRNQLFTLQWADGMGYGARVLNSSRIDLNTGVQTEITFKASPVVEMFIAEKPTYSGMDYDQINDFFLFYSGIGAAAGRVYKIQPSSTSNEWEMTLLATTPTSAKLPPTPGAGINSSFKYIPRLKGFVAYPTQKFNLFFIRTAQ